MPDLHPHRRPRGLELAVLAAALLACLLPFATRAFHIDDTLFVWAAQHIRDHPLDFYGFDVHWYNTWEPMSRVTQNPPVGCYYLALAGALFGWGEVGLHLAMILPAWGAVWGTYQLAERFGVRPLPAALLTLFTPAMLVSATSVMCDVMMICLWLWTILLWDRGLRSRSTPLIVGAGCLIALTTMTKYFGICLMPLLGVYSYTVDRTDWRRWGGAGLGSALLLLVAYQGVFTGLYGIERGLTGAMGYATVTGQGSVGGRVFRFFEGLAFVGGCIGFVALPAIFLLNFRSRLIVAALVAAASIAAVRLTGVVTIEGYDITDSPFAGPTPPATGVLIQFLVWVAAGSALLILTIDDLRAHRDPLALLLFLWIFGTTVFAAYVNWALNGRSILPMIPAVAIVLLRRFDLEQAGSRVLPFVLLPAAVLALVVSYADFSMANANRAAAEQIAREWSSPPGRPLWFQGHWGFQYYIQTAGARPWDFDSSAGRPGDILAIPFNNCLTMPPYEFATEVGRLDVEACSWAATMYPFVGAGYYASSFDWRPLPFAFTVVPPERVFMFQLTKDQVPLPKK